jgi:hypothetical protein
MRCQHVDDDIQCRMDATRRVVVVGGDPPDPDLGIRGDHLPGPGLQGARPRPPGSRCRYRSRARQRRSVNAPDGDGPGARRTIRRALRGAQT